MKVLNAVIVVSIVVMITGFSSYIVCAASGSRWAVTGSGRLRTALYDHTNFIRLSVHRAFEVDITKADFYSVSITADDNLFDHIVVEKTGESLHIGMKPASTFVRATLKAAVTMPDLKALNLTGASKGKISGFSFPHPVNFGLSGGSDLMLEAMETGDTEFKMSGASRVSGIIKMSVIFPLPVPRA
jgi:hypothetical protein